METALRLKRVRRAPYRIQARLFRIGSGDKAILRPDHKTHQQKKEDDKKDPKKGKTNNGPLGIDPDTLRWAIRRSLKKGLEEAQEAKQAVETFGRQEGGIQRIPITEQFRLADLLGKNAKIKEIVKMLGRMRLEALSIKRSRITHSAPVRRGVETVGIEGIERVLPDELANLAIGEQGEDLFLKRLLDEDLLAYSYKNPVEETQGPILIAVDGSGSMADQKRSGLKLWRSPQYFKPKRNKGNLTGSSLAQAKMRSLRSM